MGFWLTAYLTLTAAALLQAGLLLLQTWEHRRFVRRRAVTPKAEGRKRRIAIIAPCKGLDAELAGNLAPLFEQDFPNYEIVFVIDSEQDSAYPLLQSLVREHPAIAARIIVAGQATGCGQKVHNLRFAVASLPSEVDVLAFVDSDARPGRDWLRQLSRRIGPKGNAAATSYRWFVPLRPSWPNLLLASLDHSLTPLSCPGRNYLVWGGSWAIRRDVFDAVGLMQAWQAALSDDMVAARVLTAAGVHIEFEPMAIVASPLDVGWRPMFAFVRRQFMVVRWNSPRWWLVGLLLAAASQIFFWSNLASAAILGTLGNAWGWLPCGVAVALYILQICRAWLRQSASSYYLPQWQAQLRTDRTFDLVCHPLAAALNLCGLLASGWGNTLLWRGIRYRRCTDGTVRVVEKSAASGGRPPELHAHEARGQHRSAA